MEASLWFALGLNIGMALGNVWLAYYSVKNIKEHYATIAKRWEDLGAAQKEFQVVQHLTQGFTPTERPPDRVLN